MPSLTHPMSYFCQDILPPSAHTKDTFVNKDEN